MKKNLAIFFLLCACGSGSGTSSGGANSADAGSGSGDAIVDMFATFDTMVTVVTTALNVGLSSGQHVHCSDDNQATVDGTETGGTFSATIDFGGCETVEGDAAMDGTYADAAGERTFTAGFTGSAAGNGCTLALDTLAYVFTVSTDLITSPTLEEAGGILTATCSEPAGEAVVTCDFGDGVVANNTSAREAACSCSGAGC